MHDAQPVEGTSTLLIVDDDKNITSSLQRTLRGKPYHVLTAENGDTALQVLEQNSIDLVISDGRMPGMDGAALLAEVRRRWPDRMRMLLTGYPDIGATIDAINEGGIYRYISKPWDDAELCTTIERALASRNHARRKTRTELRQSHAKTVEIFSSLINQRLPQGGSLNKEIAALAHNFCKAQGLPQKLMDDLALAATLYNVGKLTWPDALITVPADQMDREQRERYRDYPCAGGSLLAALDPTHDAAKFVRHHQERWDGTGFPDGLAGHAIPLGARILKLAVDFVEMREGIVLTRRLTRDEVLANMPKYAMRLYDPLLCPEFIEVAGKVDSPGQEEEDSTILALTIPCLEPGMIMAQDLHAGSGMLLLKGGQALTESLINKLQIFEDADQAQYTLHVRRPDQNATEGGE
ncbi:response regulator [Paralcaligenes sp. KSB-10]|uniref:HD domain-containing phosphohydrolase n=1 Tax=Paralcaligenes sp. KSB-10 TaxID=2901142 RepID=UPI001E4DE6FD|nr:HD domain-containing phosphohydrolase [Paralcaligenes sp. KSB-10]UHL65389.1 response regulator [Paralcaligenes sp. KSB-10]